MASKRRIGAIVGASSKSVNHRITDFYGPPARLKRQKTQGPILDSATEPQSTTMAPSLAESSWEDKPSLADLNLFSQEEQNWEVRDTKPPPQPQRQKVNTGGGFHQSNEKKQHYTRTRASSTSTVHSLPGKTRSEPKTRKIVLTYEQGDLFDAPPNSVLIHACNTIGKWGGGIALAFKKSYPAAFEIYRKHCQEFTPDELVGTALLIAPQSDKYSHVRDDEVEAGSVEGDDEAKDAPEVKDEDRAEVDENEVGNAGVQDTDGKTSNASKEPPEEETTNWIQVPKRSIHPQEQRFNWARQNDDDGSKSESNPQRRSPHEKDIHYVACLFTSKNVGAKRDPPDEILKHTESAMLNFLSKLNDVKFNQEDCPFIPQVRMCKINSGLFGVPWERTSGLLDGMPLSRFQTWGRGDFKIVVASKDGDGVVNEENGEKKKKMSKGEEWRE
ncbi:uncharacterized protein PODANS_6_4140 [Podospora anserina S mat+]|uniref:ADP-ribose 1''-phosphate phosphatase n=1 Tax=Podospora anserina (strain S / ATCC MYA-4624 / DSM 980 / FGSC 10383) TaxID=515849 RepID=B2B1Q9_PODAN|nr:uncharacterized protein PODANS_6_4140 [Podospora anserina S mat+]CAP71044.1 unnamed protein product [Podospora anserina S mat+]CDP30444.1 Putative protein of unknown function [Podospora anserina S mat+]